MVQTAKEYQRKYFEKMGYKIFESMEDAILTFGNIYPHIPTEDILDSILNDTNCDWVVLNDKSVAVLPQVLER